MTWVGVLLLVLFVVAGVALIWDWLLKPQRHEWWCTCTPCRQRDLEAQVTHRHRDLEHKVQVREWIRMHEENQRAADEADRAARGG